MNDRSKPMDPSAKEGDGVMHMPNPRNTYGMDQFLSEMEFLFPGLGYEVSNRDGRGIAHDVQFDLTTVLSEDREDFAMLIRLVTDTAYNDDRRIAEVLVDSEGVLLSFRNDSRIQDDRSEFGLSGAWAVLRGDSL